MDNNVCNKQSDTFTQFAVQYMIEILQHDEEVVCKYCPLREQCEQEEEENFMNDGKPIICTQWLRKKFGFDE